MSQRTTIFILYKVAGDASCIRGVDVVFEFSNVIIEQVLVRCFNIIVLVQVKNGFHDVPLFWVG